VESSDLTGLVAGMAGPSTSVGGALKGTLAVGGTVAAPTATGEIRLTRLTIARTNRQCPDPKQRTLSIPSVVLASTWREGRFTAEPMRADLAKGTVTGRLTVDVEHGMSVRLDDLSVKALPTESVLVDFLCQGYAVSGPLDLTGALSFAVARPLETLSGPGSLRIGPGKIVGKQALGLIAGVVRLGSTVSTLLGADVPASVFTSPVDYDAITGTYQITDGVAHTRDLVYRSPAMTVGVAGDYVLASGAMKLDVVLNHGRGEVHARVTGTTASPVITVSPSTVLRSLDRDKVESGLRDLLKQFR